MGIIIMFNMFMIIVETDYGAEHDDSLPWADVVGWMNLAIFVTELAMRLFALRMQFWMDYWNTFDFFIVVSDASCSLLALIIGDIFPVSTLRIFRLCKLARVSKVFRVFPELRIMMAGLLGSMRALFWGTVLLAVVLLVWAIVAVQFIHPLTKELAKNGGLTDCDRCPRAYSSVAQATLTFSQQVVAGDSWGTATIPVIEAYPASALFFLAVFLSIGFAVMNLILGVVVNVAQTEHDNLKREIQVEEGIERMENREELLKICTELDEDGSGELTREELNDGYDQRDDFRDALNGMELTKDDLNIGFAAMDPDKSGTVTYMELVKKLYTMKETETAFLLEQIKYYVMQVKDHLGVQIGTVQQEMEILEKVESATQEKVSLAEDAVIELMANTPPAKGSSDEKAQKKFQPECKQPVLPAKDEEKNEESLRAAGSLGSVPNEDESSVGRQAEAAPLDIVEAPKTAEILDILAKFGDALQRIEARNEQLASDTSNLMSAMSQFSARTPKNDSARQSPNIATGLNAASGSAVCCKV
jgi:translation elongation factor EF-1beta